MNNKFYIMFAAVLGLGYIFSLILMKKNGSATKQYLTKYPDAVKIYLKSTNVLVASSSIEVAAIDKEIPGRFRDKNGHGVYCRPGKGVVIEAQFSSQRVGVLHKQVINTTDFIPLEVDIEKGKNYIISFDKKTNEFKINEK